MTDWIGSDLVDSRNQVVPVSEIQGYKLIMIVYTAHWCRGAQLFKDVLMKLYNQINEGDDEEFCKNLQIVYVSGDKNEEGFKQTIEGIPWVAIQFGGECP